MVINYGEKSSVTTSNKIRASISCLGGRHRFGQIIQSVWNLSELKEKPIFVVCMPRSGSTLVERILSAHSDVCGLGELNTAGVITSELLREDKSPERKVHLLREYYLDSVVIPDAGARYFVDKTPENFRLLPMLGEAFPEARVIHVYRDLAATCWSNYEHYFTSLGLGIFI